MQKPLDAEQKLTKKHETLISVARKVGDRNFRPHRRTGPQPLRVPTLKILFLLRQTTREVRWKRPTRMASDATSCDLREE